MFVAPEAAGRFLALNAAQSTPSCSNCLLQRDEDGDEVLAGG
jgi:hypothetical protein